MHVRNFATKWIGSVMKDLSSSRAKVKDEVGSMLEFYEGGHMARKKLGRNQVS